MIRTIDLLATSNNVREQASPPLLNLIKKAVPVQETPLVQPTLDVNSLSDLLLSKRTDGRNPVSGSLELTARCNLTCQHCYINEPANDRVARSKELNTQQVLQIIDQIVDEGGLYLTLTGGEVLLRPDFREIYLHARHKGLLVTIFTNATLVTTKIADFLAEYPPVSLEISIYGYTEETYEKVTGIKGSYAKFRRGVSLLHERGLKLVIKTVVMTLNEHELDDMKQFAANVGAHFGYDTAIFARLDGGKQPCGLRVSPENVLALDQADPTNECELVEAFERQKPEEDDALYRCGAGKNTFHVTAYGGVAICTISKTVDYNLKDGSFAGAWNGPLKDMRDRKKSDVFTKCKTCQVKQYCTICPAKAALESGNPEFQIDFFCSVAELRAKNLGSQRKTFPLTVI